MTKPVKFKERIPGGLPSGLQPSNFSAEALAEGIRVELEHTTSRRVATEIAMDHLTEDPLYYTKLRKIERQKAQKAAEAKVPPFRIPRKTSQNLVDASDSPLMGLLKSKPLKVKRAPKSADLAYIASYYKKPGVSYRDALHLRAFDRSKTQDYNVIADHYRISPTASEGPMYVGEVEIRQYLRPSLDSNCQEDYLTLLMAASAANLKVRSVWNVGWSHTCWESERPTYRPRECVDNYRGMGVATALYAKALELISTPGTITFLVADACTYSSTSPDARKVYPSLLRSHIGKGLVVTNARYGTSLGRMLAAGLLTVRKARR